MASSYSHRAHSHSDSSNTPISSWFRYVQRLWNKSQHAAHLIHSSAICFLYKPSHSEHLMSTFLLFFPFLFFFVEGSSFSFPLVGDKFSLSTDAVALILTFLFLELSFGFFLTFSSFCNNFISFSIFSFLFAASLLFLDLYSPLFCFL